MMITPDGLFVTESHYVRDLISDLQADCVYHEHLRHYSVRSLQHLLERHGLEILHVKQIPTHGGSIRVYAARKGTHPVQYSVQQFLNQEGPEDWGGFRRRVMEAKLQLYHLLANLPAGRVFGIGCPSRAVTLVHYLGLDEGILDCVVEVPNSPKINHYVPGTKIPIYSEQKLYDEQPEYALLLSWHIKDELISKIKAKVYKGKFIIPLPEPRIV